MLHGAGELDAALAWYRRGLGRGAGAGFGRNKFEVAQGILFVLGEQGRFAEAADELARYDAAYPDRQLAAEHAYLSLLRGEAPALADYPSGPQFQDLHLYWRFEIRLALGADPEPLIQELRASTPVRSDYAPLFDALEGELMARRGQRAEGAARIHAALRQARLASLDEPNYRVHLELLERRLAALRH
jgi:hypothetical protein